MRHLLKVLPTKTLQAISPTSSETYKAWTKKRVPEDDSLEFAVDDLEWNGSGKARVLWLGKKPITMPRDRRGKVILYAHGGGFVLPLAKSHLEFLEWIREKVCVENGVIVSFALVEYSRFPILFFLCIVNDFFLGMVASSDSNFSVGTRVHVPYGIWTDGHGS
jgi:acetyl esterase/lipase